MDSPVLARVNVPSLTSPAALPVYAILQDGDGQDYLVVFSTWSDLERSGCVWRPLAEGVAPEECVLARQMRQGARALPRGKWRVLDDDGEHWILQADARDTEQLAGLGFALQRLTREPIEWPGTAGTLRKAGDLPGTFAADPSVAAMVATVQATNLHTMVARLSGQEPVLAGGKPQLINTRRTPSGLPLNNALETAFARLSALGLQPAYQSWASAGYSNLNLYATLPGTTDPDEMILLTAHIDDMPSGALAPGADDNASGCAAVLTAAGIYSEYRFARTIRFLLFTGEEQGLLGSAAFAASAQRAGDNVVAVVNLDMIGWDAAKPATFQLHTRRISNPGYTNDLAIAAAFTNAVAVYGLRATLEPVIKADGLTASDHYAFWNKNFPAVAATEDYDSDFNPYYHSVNDTLSRLNMPYFTAAVRATVAAVAHLADPVGHVPASVLEVANSDWNPSSGIGGSALIARQLPGAGETGPESYDVAITNLAPNPNPRWLKLDTIPYGVELAVDSRPDFQESIFSGELTAVSNVDLPVSCRNMLRFEFLSPPAAERVYLARIEVGAEFTADHNPFLCITNVREVVGAGGYVQLPDLAGVAPGARYGTCEIASRFLRTDSTSCPLSLISISDSNLVFATQTQVGTRIEDEIEFSTELRGDNWTPLASFELDAAANSTTFQTGWLPAAWSVSLSVLPASPSYFFRLRRTWVSW